MDNDIESIFQALFGSTSDVPDVPHGQEFDDGRRWCHGCLRPRYVAPIKEPFTWKDRCCGVCSALWPEYVAEFVQSAMQNELEELETDLIYIH
jgi:hypothetical protein